MLGEDHQTSFPTNMPATNSLLRPGDCTPAFFEVKKTLHLMTVVVVAGLYCDLRLSLRSSCCRGGGDAAANHKRACAHIQGGNMLSCLCPTHYPGHEVGAPASVRMEGVTQPPATVWVTGIVLRPMSARIIGLLKE